MAKEKSVFCLSSARLNASTSLCRRHPKVSQTYQVEHSTALPALQNTCLSKPESNLITSRRALTSHRASGSRRALASHRPLARSPFPVERGHPAKPAVAEVA